MSLKAEWAVLRARLERLLALAPIAAQAGINEQVPSRRSLDAAVLQAQTAFGDFVARYERLVPVSSSWRQVNQQTAAQGQLLELHLISLAAFVAEVDAILADPEREWAQLAERAFLHLQRTLSVDPFHRKTWIEAFEEGETALETLGACHLLLHGLFAFKAHGRDARTDLILGKPLTIEDDASRVRAAAPLVLTEWKKVDGDFDAKLAQAQSQLESYAAGVVNQLELGRTTYAILVSQKELKLKMSELELGSGRLMRIVNIAVNPDTPSVGARRRSAP